MICTIKKVRRLPAQGRILVALGDSVRPDTAVGKLDYVPGQLTKYPLAEELRIAPEHLAKAMLKRVGDWIEEGEAVAATQEFNIRRVARSPGNGYIGLVSRFLGDIYVRSPLPAGPSEPVTVAAKDYNMSVLAFIASLAVQPADRVEKGQELVIEPFKTKSDIVSPVFGVVTDISRTNGTITIKPLYQATEVFAHVAGRVTATVPGESVEITTEAHVVQGIIGYGGERVGTLLPLADNGRDFDVADLPAELTGAIVIGRRGATAAALQRCADGGAVGVILGSARYNPLREFLGADPLKVTGSGADIPLTVILIQGFGALPMNDEAFTELSTLAGQTASIDGSTQLRAGVVRPEVIVARGVAS